MLSGICGALPEEQERAQPLEVDLDVVADLVAGRRAPTSSPTPLDYGAIAAGGRAGRHDRALQLLLERLAQRVAEVVLADARATSVTVAVRKLRPPVPAAPRRPRVCASTPPER